ncbi:hypothetical protein CYMTET_20688 [Cymbomonas tetramitiformis]|uniref:Uncharacterized protein n=1 Tax=Cymbomonas tetramitiformis TaxID=36881 RepID=A0AAE0G4U5_9CHLO|nr:hypothetical protein CYMTET_20688 [Cymbomonas tetramitiformis]
MANLMHGLVFDLHAEDWSGSGAWVDRAGWSFRDAHGTTEKVTQDGVAAVCLSSDADYFQWNIDVGPSAMPNASFEVYFYLHCRANDLGWLFGDENGDCDRYLLVHDSRTGGGGVAPSCQSNSFNSDPAQLGAWNHIVTYYGADLRTYALVTTNVRQATYGDGFGYLRFTLAEPLRTRRGGCGAGVQPRAGGGRDCCQRGSAT